MTFECENFRVCKFADARIWVTVLVGPSQDADAVPISEQVATWDTSEVSGYGFDRVNSTVQILGSGGFPMFILETPVALQLLKVIVEATGWGPWLCPEMQDSK